MAPDLLAIARRHLSRAGTPHEGNDRNEQSPPTAVPPAGLSSYPSFLSSPAPGRPNTWGCHLAEVVRLLADADRAVETFGVSGTHPEVASAAEMVTSAVLTGDVETVRFAATEFVIVVKAATRNQLKTEHPRGG